MLGEHGGEMTTVARTSLPQRWRAPVAGRHGRAEPSRREPSFRREPHDQEVPDCAWEPYEQFGVSRNNP